jgi:hypothetical protein
MHIAGIVRKDRGEDRQKETVLGGEPESLCRYRGSENVTAARDPSLFCTHVDSSSSNAEGDKVQQSLW